MQAELVATSIGLTSNKEKMRRCMRSRSPLKFGDNTEVIDNNMKWIDSFVPIDSKVVEGSKKAKADKAQESSSKRAADDELEQERAKKQKIDDAKEEAEMRKLINIVPDEEEVAIDAIPLATKPPSIGRSSKKEKLVSIKS
ncbi:hypothetical protein Tco_1214186 [Tanacetum coccineum]